MARDPRQTRRSNPLLAWITIGVLLALVVGLFAVYMLRPGRSTADDTRTAAAIGDMDAAQDAANERRDRTRKADGLLN